MAWLDDRVWCHPKFTDLSDRAGWTWARGVAYASGMGTEGVLTVGQQKMVGSDARTRRELVAAGLWHEGPDESVSIHDWLEHNGKRDERRAADRERKRKVRALSAGRSAGKPAGQPSGQPSGRSTGPAHVEGSEGSDGSEGSEEIHPKAVSPLQAEPPRPQDVFQIQNTIERSLRSVS